MEQTDLRYLKSLAKQYPTVAAAATEIINLQAILSLPKGTEHFIVIDQCSDRFLFCLTDGIPELVLDLSLDRSGTVL